MPYRRRTACRAVLFFLAVAALTRADVRPPEIFGDHPVLQKGARLPAWGTAKLGGI
jgi:hypothetical protein